VATHLGFPLQPLPEPPPHGCQLHSHLSSPPSSCPVLHAPAPDALSLGLQLKICSLGLGFEWGAPVAGSRKPACEVPGHFCSTRVGRSWGRASSSMPHHSRCCQQQPLRPSPPKSAPWSPAFSRS
jgi:hypothetical protein